jgi:hypothetical protein
MPYPPSAYDLHQRQRWLRHDAHLWLRHDYARWLKPGTDPEELYPHLKRQREAAEDAAFAAQIAASQRVLTMLRAEVDELKAARARQRLQEAKYSRISRACRPAIRAAGSGVIETRAERASVVSETRPVTRTRKARMAKTQAVQAARKIRTAEESLIRG